MTNFEISNKSEYSDFLLFVHFVLANTHFKKILKRKCSKLRQSEKYMVE